jgi:ABC-type branched-subunit amino acid transport system ATPase component
MTAVASWTDERGPARSPAASDALLVVSDLHCSFGGVQAVNGTGFEVQAGSLTGLIGPNGAGKSTVINAIAGQIRPDSGSVCFDGEELQGLPTHRIARAGITRTFQTPNLFPRLTVLENMLLGAPPWRGESLLSALAGGRLWRRGQDRLIEQAQAIMQRFGTVSLQNEYAEALSGGQKRIVEIMRALMASPKLLLLDEPMAGVNPTLALRIAEHLDALRASGVTMLMVEHDLRVVGEVCEPVIVMVQGRAVAEGTLAELRQNEEVVRAYLS